MHRIGGAGKWQVVEESPGAFLGLIFGQVGDWLKSAFGEE